MSFSLLSISQGFWKNPDIKIENPLFFFFLSLYFGSVELPGQKKMAIKVNLVYFLGFRCTGNVQSPAGLWPQIVLPVIKP